MHLFIKYFYVRKHQTPSSLKKLEKVSILFGTPKVLFDACYWNLAERMRKIKLTYICNSCINGKKYKNKWKTCMKEISPPSRPFNPQLVFFLFVQKHRILVYHYVKRSSFIIIFFYFLFCRVHKTLRTKQWILLNNITRIVALLLQCL